MGLAKVFILTGVFFLSPVHQLLAQDESKVGGRYVVGIGVEAGVPVGNLSLVSSIALGGSMRIERVITDNVGLTLDAGFINYFIKGGGDGVGYIPLLAGLKYRFTPNVYGAGQIGAAFSTNSGVGTGFAYATGIGLELSPQWDGFLRYSAISHSDYTVGNFGVRIAYNFNK